jgi:phosphomannomutase
MGTAGGAMITASHNPGKYNGIKMCHEGARPIGIDSGLHEIMAAISSDNYKSTDHKGEVRQKNVLQAWIKHALSFVDVAKWPHYRLAIDAGNGMAGAIVPELEKHLTADVTEMFFELDGTFPNHPANPVLAEGIKPLSDMVKQKGLDFGIAFDGDGDRAFLVDETGKPVSGSQMSAMLAVAFLAKYPGASIVYGANNSKTVPEVITERGGKPVRSKVGHSNIKAVMREVDAPFGGELSGHFYFRDNYYADSGLIGALVAVDVLAKSGKKLSELVDQYEHYSASGEINSTVSDAQAKMKELAAKYSDGEKDNLDGLSVSYPDWWFNVRGSNTEPLLRLNVEAKDPAEMAKHRDELLELIRS